MKATGIVRRIDDLGRVVIPKEIRRSCGLREGDPLEIYLGTDREIVLKKYQAEPDDLYTRAKEFVKKFDVDSFRYDISGLFTRCFDRQGHLLGTARCSTEDPFDYIVGIAVALGKAINNPFDYDGENI